MMDFVTIAEKAVDILTFDGEYDKMKCIAKERIFRKEDQFYEKKINT